VVVYHCCGLASPLKGVVWGQEVDKELLVLSPCGELALLLGQVVSLALVVSLVEVAWVLMGLLVVRLTLCTRVCEGRYYLFA